MYSVSAYKYFFERGIIKNNISKSIRNLDKYDQLEADRILERLSHNFFQSLSIENK